MADGVVLLADRWAPEPDEPRPVVLLRSPYGRSGLLGIANGAALARTGLQVVIQSVRGTFGSGGTWEPMRNEAADAAATLTWLRQQAFFDGRLLTTGPSYLGYTQWALAAGEAAELVGMVPTVTESDLGLSLLAAGQFGLETSLAWALLLDVQERRPLEVLALTSGLARRWLRRGMDHLPLGEADRALLGHEDSFYQASLAHDRPDDPYWATLDHTASVARVGVPVHFVAGWYDLFLTGELADYERLRAAGHAPSLTIGPWSHTSPALSGAAARATVSLATACLGSHAAAGTSEAGQVTYYVLGRDLWRRSAGWPPEGAEPLSLYLWPGSALSEAPPPPSTPDRYRYDPEAPTPAVGGPSLMGGAGAVDNRRLEARPDVCTYTSTPLSEPLEVAGVVRARIWFTSDAPSADLFVRLCRVERHGRSVNVCDAAVSVPRPPGPDRELPVLVELALSSTACAFMPGERIRVQVSSGAHPRFARNLGTGEPRSTARHGRVANQAVLHDPAHPSSITLPVLDAPPPVTTPP